ncbi:MAG: acyltransferase [Acidobacteriota bacterium]
MKRIPQLDGVRGLAILQVMIWHYQGLVHAQLSSSVAYGQKVLQLSWSGVDLFFVLSGFLIGGTLMDNRAAGNYFKVFYVRRFFRIVPLYLLMLIVGQSLVWVDQLDAGSMGEMLPWGWYLLFGQNVWMALHTWSGAWNFWLGQSWSLAVEEQFYLLLPIAIWLLPPRAFPPALVGAIVGSIGFRFGLFMFLPADRASIAAHVLLPARMDSLLLGVLAALAVRRVPIRTWLSARLGWLYGVLVMLIAGAIGCIAKGWGLNSSVMETAGLTGLALLYTAFLLIAVLENRGPIRVLTTLAPLRQLGFWAYSLFLIHPLVSFCVLRVPPPTSPLIESSAFIAALCGVLLLAHASWRCIERPLMEFGHRLKFSGSSQV